MSLSLIEIFIGFAAILVVLYVTDMRFRGIEKSLDIMNMAIHILTEKVHNTYKEERDEQED